MSSAAVALAVFIFVVMLVRARFTRAHGDTALGVVRGCARGAAEAHAFAWLAQLQRVEPGSEVVVIPGARDLDDIQSIAALAIAGVVGESAMSRDAHVTTIAPHPLVLRVVSDREPPPESATALFISDDPWGFAAGACGEMTRDRPARCLLAGGFSAEAILIADGAREIGATVFAGTADLAQAPALLLTSDHALIGDEFFAASMLAAERRPRSFWVVAQDRCKAVALTAILAICGLLSIAEVSGSDTVRAFAREIAGHAAPE
jgi:hypothetical protein